MFIENFTPSYHYFNSKKDLVIAIINEKICLNSLDKYVKLDEIKDNKLKAKIGYLELESNGYFQ